MAAPHAAPGSIAYRPATAIPARTTPAETRMLTSSGRSDRAPGSSPLPPGAGASLATGLPLLLLVLLEVPSGLLGGAVKAADARGEPEADPEDRQPGSGPQPFVQVISDGQADDDRDRHLQAQGAVFRQLAVERPAVLFVSHGKNPD